MDQRQGVRHHFQKDMEFIEDYVLVKTGDLFVYISTFLDASSVPGMPCIRAFENMTVAIKNLKFNRVRLRLFLLVISHFFDLEVLSPSYLINTSGTLYLLKA